MTIALAVHSAIVFFAEVDERTPISTLVELLSAEERMRASRFVSGAKSREFIAAHALLRLCFRATTGRLNWPLSCNAYGKPEIYIPPAPPPLRFSLTHTCGVVACAVAESDEIGVDAEALNPALDAISLANSFFARAERDMLARLPKAEVIPAFFALWTYKEAIAKAMGRGLYVGFSDFAVSQSPPSVVFENHLNQDPGRWTLDSLSLPKHQLAVAVIRAGRALSTSKLKWQRIDFVDLNPFGFETSIF